MPYSASTAWKIQNGELPGLIRKSNGDAVRIIDFTYSDTHVLAMVMNNNLEEESEELDKANGLLLYVPEWYTFIPGNIVCCKLGSAPNKIECLSILRMRPEYLSNGRVWTVGLANCITYSDVLPNQIMIDVKSSGFDTVRAAKAPERRLFAERLVQDGSQYSLELLHKYMPEYSYLAKQPQHNE